MKKNTLYLECYSGISGDMTVAALLDLGADQNVLLEGLKSLNVDGYKIEISRKAKNSIDACDFNVILDESIDQHDHEIFDEDKLNHENNHDHGHLHSQKHDHKQKNAHEPHHSHDHPHDHEHHHDPEHHHDHDHHHDHEHLHNDEHLHDHKHPHNDEHQHSHGLGQPVRAHIHYGHHEHRNLYDINSIIEQSNITQNAKDIAKKIFQIVAVAESKAHGKPVEEVHFHEVGAVDSIVDIVATAICLDNLNVGDVVVSELHEGTGHIKCQHGVLPVPVPAVVNIAAAHQLQLHITSVKGELVTPTGAAIVAAIKTKDKLPKEFKIKRIGLGAGKRKYERASFLRAMLIKDTTVTTESMSSNTTADTVWVLETNIDDCSGEELSMAMELLLQNGAKDVYYTPIFMKKNRPAYMLGVICSEKQIELLEEIIFTHTTSIGLRKYQTTRTTLNREFLTIRTPYGEAIVKVCSFKDKKYYYPEYESIKKLCTTSELDYKTMYSIVQALAVDIK
jgi:hypothetical protein